MPSRLFWREEDRIEEGGSRREKEIERWELKGKRKKCKVV
jgi:hypothetical protein